MVDLFLRILFDRVISCLSGGLFANSTIFLNPSRVVDSLVFEHNVQALQPFKNSHQGPLMHDSNVEFFLVFDNESPELTFPHATLPVQIVKHLNISVELQRSTLPFGLLDSEN